MKKNLIFKRVVGGSTEMRVVPVEIDDSLLAEGFQLVSWCDTIHIAPSVEKSTEHEVEDKTTPKLLQLGDKFESRISGTARLIRTAKKIRIAYRRGKSTLNQTSPDSVCIDDVTKNYFFNDVKSYFGGDPEEWSIPVSINLFSKWSKFIDAEYTRQLETINQSLKTRK